MWSLLCLSLLVGHVISIPVDEIEQSDIIAEEIVEYDIDEYPRRKDVILMGDIELDPHRNAISDSHRWPNGKVPYVFSSKYSSSVKSDIETAMREIEKDVNGHNQKCVQFVPRSSETNYVYVLPRSHQCSSKVGDSHHGRQELSLGSGCTRKGTIMHELIHALGFHHEQSRPDRDNYVNIDLSNVRSGHEGNYHKSSSSRTLGTKYDFGSIMHYNAYEFAENKRKPVMTPKSGKGVGIMMGQRIKLSVTDVLKIQKLYGCTQDTSHIQTPEASSDEICRFTTDTCDMKNTGTLKFSVKKGADTHNSHGPYADHSNGRGGYALATGSGHHATLETKTLTGSEFCVDFYLYQSGPTSYVSVETIRSGHRANSFSSYAGQFTAGWHHHRIHLHADASKPFKIHFNAHMSSGDVALDDIWIHKGDCV